MILSVMSSTKERTPTISRKDEETKERSQAVKFRDLAMLSGYSMSDIGTISNLPS